MGRAFTLIEMLVILLVMVLLAMLVTPACGKAKIHVHPYTCKANLHNIGMALRSFRTDNDDKWPAHLMLGKASNTSVNTWGRLYGGQYLDDVEVFKCPNFDDADLDLLPCKGYERESVICWAGFADGRGDMPSVLNSSYGYDNGRIPKNTDPGRAIAAANLETQWRGDYRDDEGRSYPCSKPARGSWFVDPCYEDGTHMLTVDAAVQWIDTSGASRFWAPRQGLSPGGRESSMAGPAWCQSGYPWTHGSAGHGDDPRWTAGAYPVHTEARKYDFVRAGVIMNPRVNEDEHPNGSHEHWEGGAPIGVQAPAAVDLDDIFAIEARTEGGTLPAQWELLAEWQHYTSYLRRESYYGVDPEKHVPMSKTDACIVPTIGFRAGCGLPDSERPVGD